MSLKAAVRFGAGLLLLVGEVSAETEVIYGGEETMGVVAPPESANLWQARRIVAPGVSTKSEDCTAFADSDFFANECGGPVAPFSFTVGSNGWSRLWGAAGLDHETPSARFGKGWEKYAGAHYRLELDVEQNVDASDWNFVRNGRYGRHWWRQNHPFTVKGKGRQTVLHELGVLNLDNFPYHITGVELECKTKGAAVKVHGARVVPYGRTLSWRRKFALDEKPHRAGITFRNMARYRLRVNDRVVREGNGALIGGYVKQDLSEWVRTGENEVVFTANCAEGWDQSPIFEVELFAVLPDGRTELFHGGDGWEWKEKGGQWKGAQVLDRAGFDYLPNGKRISNSFVPMHAGPLEVVPVDSEASGYPVFDIDEKAAWRVRLPPRMRNADVTATVRKVLGDVRSPAGKAVRRGDTFVFEGLDTGAYVIDWTLRQDGRTVDTLESEMIVAGPIRQDFFDLEAIDAETDRRLVKVWETDCTREDANPTNFLDNSAIPPKRGTRVESRGGIAFRKTGESLRDFLSYRVELKDLGAAHILEIDYPDLFEQVLYASLLEQYPINFCNNGFPVGSRAWPNATGTVKCGGAMPLSGERGRMRVVFFPGARHATVNLENGLQGTPAAVCAFRIYRVEGGLPALRLPPTARRWGNHSERPVFTAWGAAVTPKAFELDPQVFRGYQYRLWAAAYLATANRISYMRFAGQNAAIEGGYMYFNGYPSATGESKCPWVDFDFSRLIYKLFRHNGIRAYVNYEYICSPKVTMSGARAVSDSEIRNGTARSAECVDRYGKQANGDLGALNFLSKPVHDSMCNVMREMYARYGGLGAIEGVVAQVGWKWQPCYSFVIGDVQQSEVGYDDESVERFERDTGIRLGLPKTGADRFARRYELLMGKYRKEWKAWRSKVIGETLGELCSIARSGKEKWDFLVAQTIDGHSDNPFKSYESTLAERDGYFADSLSLSEIDMGCYGRGDGLKFLPKVDSDQELRIGQQGLLTNRPTVDFCNRFDSLYLAQCGLNEHIGVSVRNAPQWWWRGIGCAVYDTKQSGDAAFHDVTGWLVEKTPRTLFHTWLDINLPTAWAAEERRAAHAFYSTPLAEGRRYDGVIGVSARDYGGRLQLVNDTPYAVTGSVDGFGRVDLRPFGMKVLNGIGKGRFSFVKDLKTVIATQRKALADPRIRSLLPERTRAAIDGATCDYERVRTLRDYEVLRVVDRALGADGLRKYVNGRNGNGD